MIDFPVLPSGEKPVWDGERFQLGQRSSRVLAYSSNFAGWDDDLTELHEAEAGDGRHPIDIASRSTAIDALRRYGFPTDGAVLEIGCSSGFLLHDLRQEFPHAEIVGADIVVKPLERLGESMPGVPLVQMDLLQCPLRARQFDAVVALNVIEHIEDDGAALEKMASLLKPGGILVLEVPQGPNLYDYFDAYLRHFRRYSKKDLLAKIAVSGLQLQDVNFLGFVPYLPFWVMKKLNRLRFGLRGEKSTRIEEMVRKQIKTTARSKVFQFAFAIEKALSEEFSFPMGIRCTVVSRASVIAGAVMSAEATFIQNGKMSAENNLSPMSIDRKVNADISAKWPKTRPRDRRYGVSQIENPSTQHARPTTVIPLSQVIHDVFWMKPARSRFLVVGASSALVYYSAVALAYDVIGMRYQVAVSVGYVLSVLFHFFGNRHFTFPGSGYTLSRQVFRYIALVCINYLITLSIVTAAVELLRINPYFAVAISILTTMVVSYLLMRNWIFAKAR